MRMKELELKNRLKKIVDNAKDSYGQYCSFDMYTKESHLELKCRYGSRVYPDTMIERGKYDKNIALSKEHQKDFIYVVYSEPHSSIFFFNISQLTSEGYDFKWKNKRCPQTSQFEKRGYVDKEVGGVEWDKAYHRIEVKDEQ